MRLIDADALLAEYDRVIFPPGAARKLIVNAPTVKRCTCESCMHGFAIGHGLIACSKPDAGYNNTHNAEWYCADWHELPEPPKMEGGETDDTSID